MKTAITYALLSFVMLVGATVLGRFLFTAIDHAVHAVSLVLNVN
jgi:hypothetical protein